METTTKEFADWWSTCGFTCEADEGLASHAFHSGMQAATKTHIPGRKISDRAHSYVCECEEIASDAIHNICRPLLMAGDGAFYAKNGNFVAYDVVLREHKIMQTALEKIRGKLDFAKTEIVAE